MNWTVDISESRLHRIIKKRRQSVFPKTRDKKIKRMHFKK
jgi:hypothetical protein